jgi:hypothetical protein
MGTRKEEINLLLMRFQATILGLEFDDAHQPIE